MATATFAIDDFSLRSTWSVEVVDDGYGPSGHTSHYEFGTPSTPTKSVSVNLASIPSGSRVTSAVLSAKTYGSGVRSAEANNISVDVTNDKTGANAPDVTAWFSNISGGTFGTFTIVFSFTGYASASGSSTCQFTNLALTVNYELPHSTATFNTGSIAAGQNKTITIVPSNASYTHRIKYALGGRVAWSDMLPAGTTTYNINVPVNETWLSELKNATSGTLYFRLFTYNGSTEVGSIQYHYTLTVPTNVVPTAGTFTVSPVADGAIPDGWSSLFVQNYSKAQLSLANVQGVYGSTITGVQFTGWGGSVSGTASGTTYSATSGLLTEKGSRTISAIVTDSRGRTTTVTKTITVTEYFKPYIQSITAKRCLQDGTLDDLGTYVRLVVTAAIAPVDGNNAISATSTWYKKASDANYTEAGYTFTNNTPVIIGNGQISTDNAYNIRARLRDKTGALAIGTATVPTATYVLHFRDGGKAIGIGTAASATDNSLTVNSTWSAMIGGADLSKAYSHIVYQGELASGTDLNNCTTYGYYSVHTASAAGISHMPANEAGTLIVMSTCDDEKSTSVVPTGTWWCGLQAFITINGGNIYTRYLRTRDTAGVLEYGTWKKLATTDEISATDLVGTVPPSKGGTGQTSLEAANIAIGAGKTMTLSQVCFSGVITSSNSEARFTIPLGRRITAQHVAVSGTGYIHTASGKITPTDATAFTAMGSGSNTSTTVTATVNADGFVTVVISGTLGGTNNAMAVLHAATITLTFS